MLNFSVSFVEENAKCFNNELFCYITKKMSSRVNSYDLPGQVIGPALPTQHF